MLAIRKNTTTTTINNNKIYVYIIVTWSMKLKKYY